MNSKCKYRGRGWGWAAQHEAAGSITAAGASRGVRSGRASWAAPYCNTRVRLCVCEGERVFLCVCVTFSRAERRCNMWRDGESEGLPSGLDGGLESRFSRVCSSSRSVCHRPRARQEETLQHLRCARGIPAWHGWDTSPVFTNTPVAICIWHRASTATPTRTVPPRPTCARPRIKTNPAPPAALSSLLGPLPPGTPPRARGSQGGSPWKSAPRKEKISTHERGRRRDRRGRGRGRSAALRVDLARTHVLTRTRT